MVRSALFALLGSTTGLGIYLLVDGLRPKSATALSSLQGKGRFGPKTAFGSRDIVASVAVGVASFLVTGWPMAFLLGGAAVFGLKGLGSSRSNSSIARLEAIASWSEMLRDTLAGASGLSQAILATAANPPSALRQPIESLATRVKSGVALESALRDLADEIADPAADIVVASLVMATQERAQRLGDLLGALAGAIREEISMRLDVEASRTSARTAVRMITGFSLGLFVLMALFAKSYLAPYHGAAGQFALAFVGLLFALGLFLMATMVRTRPLPRLLVATEARR